MLNKFINSQISHNLNENRRLKYLNERKNNNKKTNNKNSVVNDYVVGIEKSYFLNSPNHIEFNFKTLDIRFNNDLIGESINKNIKKIHNVYKLKYKNTNATGFGDFIRSCYFLLEFCEIYNVDVDFHIYDSNIKNYLSYFISKPVLNYNIAENIDKYIDINCKFTNINGIIGYKLDENYNDFINYLNNQIVYSNNVFINTGNFPIRFIQKKNIEYMKKILEPTNLFEIDLNNLMDKLGLIKNEYITYHIRLGDKYLENQHKTIEYNILNKILNKLDMDVNKTCLLLSDSIMLKKIIIKKYPNIKTIINNICHIIENNSIEIKNTLLDFYLMSKSVRIVSFSVYEHGSGFSKWCATTYEIPYVCYAL